MSDNHQDLVAEFPRYRDLIHELKTNSTHFRNLFDRYHDVNKEIHRAAQRIEATTERHEEELRKERLKLKDELFGMLTAADQARRSS